MLLATPAAADAYLGPGLGLGVLSLVMGIFGSVFLGFAAILWYPIKRLVRRLRRKSPPASVVLREGDAEPVA
ncbi:hypothetical protein GCM10009087_48060 [Sphingomonas oligophenolica]